MNFHRTPAAIGQPTEAEIQHAAYRLWIESGRLEGHELDNWLAAKELIRHHPHQTTVLRVRPPAPVSAPSWNPKPYPNS